MLLFSKKEKSKSFGEWNFEMIERQKSSCQIMLGICNVLDLIVSRRDWNGQLQCEPTSHHGEEETWRDACCQTYIFKKIFRADYSKVHILLRLLRSERQDTEH